MVAPGTDPLQGFQIERLIKPVIHVFGALSNRPLPKAQDCPGKGFLSPCLDWRRRTDEFMNIFAVEVMGIFAFTM